MTKELWQLGVGEIGAGLRRGSFSAREVCEASLARIESVNPAINAIVARDDEGALRAAKAVDAALACGIDPGPLAGVPVTIKVNVDQKGAATTNGLRLQKDLIATSDSPVVANLRRAGAIVVGRTNTPAFSLRWFTRNALHGATRNPRNPALTPGGSSGGAGAAVAAGLCTVGHGTDIAGSIRYPAYACGVHGLRPSLGRVPAHNATGADRMIGAQLMAVSGPLARRVDDLRQAFAIMARPDPRDPWSNPAPLAGPAMPRRIAFCPAPEGLAVARSVRAALDSAALKFADAGWAIEEVAPPPLREAQRLQLRLWLAEMRHGAADAVTREGDPDALFVHEQLQRISPPIDLATMMQTLQDRARLCREWYGFLARFPLMLCPVSAEPPFEDHLDVTSPAAFDQVIEAQLLQIALPFMGLPGLTVTTDLSGATPMGVQLVAAPYREDLLLDAGAVIEAPCPPATPAPD